MAFTDRHLDIYMQEMQKGVQERHEGVRREVKAWVNFMLLYWKYRSDEYCPNCDNHFVLDAITPKAALKIESEDTRIDARYIPKFKRHFEVGSLW